jgi:hypothetical protein
LRVPNFLIDFLDLLQEPLRSLLREVQDAFEALRIPVEGVRDLGPEAGRSTTSPAATCWATKGSSTAIRAKIPP